MREPRNEQEAVYYFLRNFRELGFENIERLTTQFPDCVAIRDGKKVRIEFEFKLSRFMDHYKSKTNYKYPAFKFTSEDFGNQIKIFELSKIGDTQKLNNEIMSFSKDIFFKLSDIYGFYICEKTLKQSVDIVVCWIKDTELPENIEVIELSKLVKVDE